MHTQLLESVAINFQVYEVVVLEMQQIIFIEKQYIHSVSSCYIYIHTYASE